MERVSFLLEASNERISCLLNPESLVIRRSAGLRQRHSLNGMLSNPGLKDYPMLYTGGGQTEIEMQLLFDTTLELSGSTRQSIEDVRDWTNRLHYLTMSQQNSTGRSTIPLIRMIWGRDWNFPGVLTHLAERLEYFTQNGLPRRSWLSVRMLRVNPNPAPEDSAGLREWQQVAGQLDSLDSLLEREGQEPTDILALHDFREGERLDVLAQQYYGNVRYWRLIARYNQLDDPFVISVGQRLLIPSERIMERLSSEEERP